MAASEDQFLCSICLDPFTEPVSTPCGHNFCKHCLSQHWDTSAPCRCPLCKQLFNIRPELKVNTLVSEMISRFKQEAGSRSEVSKPGEVSCDFCTGPKLKAFKSCLVCLSSFCEPHLQPHLSVPGLTSHQLMEPLKNMQDRICLQHQKPLELFCRSDHSSVCTMCALLEHKSHEFVSLKEEFEQRKASLQQTQEESQKMVEERRQKIQELQNSVQRSEKAADKEKSMGLQAFTALIKSVQRSRDRFIQELEQKQKQTQAQAKALVQQLKKEICELKQGITEAEELQHSEDHLHFLQHCPTLPPTGLKDWSSVRLEPLKSEGTAANALSELEQGLKKTLAEEIRKVPKTEFKRMQHFAADLTLDPETAHTTLFVSKDLKEVYQTEEINFSHSPQRFSSWYNVLAKQSISSGRFYYEIQVKDKTEWYLGVVEESVDRTKSVARANGYWFLQLKVGDKYFACGDPDVPLSLKSPLQKVGVGVDYDEGLISFYDVDTEDLLYSFTGCSFKEKMFPFLNPCPHYKGTNSTPLILSTVKK